MGRFDRLKELSVLFSVAFSLFFGPLLPQRRNPLIVGEKATFKLFLNEQEAGFNTYIVDSKDETGYHIRSKTYIKTKLIPEMTLYQKSVYSEELIPKSYSLDLFAPNVHQWIRARFEEGKAKLRFSQPGKKEEKEVELELGDNFVILDNNVIDHWVYIAKRYNYNKGGQQTFSALVPQVGQKVNLSLKMETTEEIEIGGRKTTAIYLSGQLFNFGIDLWIDETNRNLLKIAIPSQNFVAVRSTEVIDFSEEEISQRIKQLQEETEEEEKFIEKGYHSEEVFFLSDSLKLAGTLTLPDSPGKTKFPALLLIAGSGAVDRNENAGVLRMYFLRQLADTLSKAGFVTLRYDKRGVGESEGNFIEADLNDLINDARSALSYLRSRPEVDAQKVGIIGHSEGAIIAPILATTDKELASLVLMAGTARPLNEVVIDQIIYLKKLQGVSQDELEKVIREQKQIFRKIQQGETIDPIKAKGNANWWRQHMENDPLTVIKKVQCPVLIMNGGKDYQVSAEKDAKLLQKALSEVNHFDHTLKIYPNLDHLFAKVEGQSTMEKYTEPGRKIDQQVLADLVSWLNEKLRKY